ncbi:MAG: 1,4-alpha-glucan-branching enzyme, partial [Paludibacteraceae bacterium]|nr:1,4-alpha-glucan-branching enzyme [Paludibacteraceae bacterium]
MMDMLNLVKYDQQLKPFENALVGRYKHFLWKESQLVGDKENLADFASGHLYFGLHKIGKKWVLREWAPNATAIYIIGDFNNWKEDDAYSLKRKDNGIWEIEMPESAMKHKDLYKLKIHWNGGEGERIPAWCRRVVQDDKTKIFSAQVWAPEKPYKFKIK